MFSFFRKKSPPPAPVETPVPAVAAAYGQGTNLLFVGRVAPNKRIEDLIKTYYFYRRLDPDSRLLVVGMALDMEPYLEGCQKLAAELPALGALGLLCAVMVGLVASEAVRYMEARERIRHEDAGPEVHRSQARDRA